MHLDGASETNQVGDRIEPPLPPGKPIAQNNQKPGCLRLEHGGATGVVYAWELQLLAENRRRRAQGGFSRAIHVLSQDLVTMDIIIVPLRVAQRPPLRDGESIRSEVSENALIFRDRGQLG
jgi:hypothetical protein